jgi:cysteine desulfurase
VEAEFVLDRLDKAGICASAGSACSAGGTEPSHVMLAMGLTPEEALSTIRISLSRYTSQLEVDQVVKALPAIVEKVMSEAA